MQADPRLRMTSREQIDRLHPGKRLLPYGDQVTDPQILEQGKRWVHDYYRYLDEAVGRVMARMDPTTSTLIFRSTSRSTWASTSRIGPEPWMIWS